MEEILEEVSEITDWKYENNEDGIYNAIEDLIREYIKIKERLDYLESYDPNDVPDVE